MSVELIDPYATAEFPLPELGVLFFRDEVDVRVGEPRDEKVAFDARVAIDVQSGRADHHVRLLKSERAKRE